MSDTIVTQKVHPSQMMPPGARIEHQTGGPWEAWIFHKKIGQADDLEGAEALIRGIHLDGDSNVLSPQQQAGRSILRS